MKQETKNSIKAIKDCVEKWYLLNEPFSLHYYTDKKRKRQFVEIRQISHKLARDILTVSFSKIGEIIGQKDHATVMHSCKTVKNLYQTNLAFRNKFNVINRYVRDNVELKRKIYLSGSITKDLQEFGWKYVYDKFQKIEDLYDIRNNIVYNPTKFFTDEEINTFTQLQFMNKCIEILVNCTHIHMLQDYKQSYNANIELLIAEKLGLTIIYENEIYQTNSPDYNFTISSEVIQTGNE